MSKLKNAIDDAGGVPVVAKACGVSPRAVYKWLAAGALPRTDFTGETQHAEKIADLSLARGFPANAAELRAASTPSKSVA